MTPETKEKIKAAPVGMLTSVCSGCGAFMGYKPDGGNMSSAGLVTDFANPAPGGYTRHTIRRDNEQLDKNG